VQEFAALKAKHFTTNHDRRLIVKNQKEVDMVDRVKHRKSNFGSLASCSGTLHTTQPSQRRSKVTAGISIERNRPKTAANLNFELTGKHVRPRISMPASVGGGMTIATSTTRPSTRGYSTATGANTTTMRGARTIGTNFTSVAGYSKSKTCRNAQTA